MNTTSNKSLNDIQFYVTTNYSCGYIKERNARSLVAAPYKKVNAKAYNDLIQSGFRRSGQYVYKPQCKDCQACVPIRLVISNFLLSRSQKRVKKNHKNIQAKILPLAFHQEHYNLYTDYQNKRHQLNSKLEEDIVEYKDFLVSSNVNSKLIEFRDNERLVMVTVVDNIEEGLSAVYTFYDCDEEKKSYGTFSILWLIDYCLKNKLSYLYLGYWINQSNKMKYKINFKPYELMIDGLWKQMSD